MSDRSDDAWMLADDLPFRHKNLVRINPNTDRPIGKRGRHAVAVAVQVNQAGGRHALGVFDEAVKARRQRHQAGFFAGPYFGNGSDRVPCGTFSQSSIQRCSNQAFSASRSAKHGMGCHSRWRVSRTFFSTCPFSPACSWIAELGIEKIVAGHGQEAGADFTHLHGQPGRPPSACCRSCRACHAPEPGTRGNVHRTASHVSAADKSLSR